MYEKLKEYLNNRIKEINEQSQQKQRYDKSIHDQFDKRTQLVYQTFLDLKKEVCLHWKIKKTEEFYKDRLAEIESFDGVAGNMGKSSIHTEVLIPEQLNKLLESEDLFIEILKLILSENYNPPTDTIDIEAEKTKEVPNLVALLYHLLTLFVYYKHLAPTFPDMPLKMILRIEYATVLVVSFASISCLVGSNRGPEHDRTLESIKTRRLSQDDRRKKVYFYYNKKKKEDGQVWEKHGISQKAEFIIKYFKAEGIPGLPKKSTIRRDLSEGKKEGLI